MSSHDCMSLQLRTVKDRNDRSNSNYKQIILDTQQQVGMRFAYSSAGRWKKTVQTNVGNCDIIKDGNWDHPWPGVESRSAVSVARIIEVQHTLC